MSRVVFGMESSLTRSSNGQDSGRELDDFSSDCQWGRYNVHYLETDGERNGGEKRPLRPKVSSSDTSAQPRIKRHVSDAGSQRKGGGPAGRNRARVSRRQSEGPNGSVAAAARSKMQATSASQLLNETGRFGASASGSCLEPCLRLSIIRHESDLRKKRVAFSDAPAVVWNDSPVVFFSSSSGNGPSVATHQPTFHTSGPSGRRHSYPSSNIVSSVDGSESKEASVNEEGGGDEVLTPKERRRRKVVMAVVCTTFILLTASALFVLITLFNASAIDEAGSRSLLFFFGPTSFLFD